MTKKQLSLFLVGSLVFTIYAFSDQGKTPYDYFVRLAGAFRQGQLYLTEQPSWLSELIPFAGKYYVAYPPMPAVLALPFVAVAGPGFNQTFLSVLVGSLNAVLVFLLLEKLKIKEKARFWLTILFSLGTIHWFLASVGSAWYLAHVVAVFFLLLALNEALGGKRAFLTGLFLGAAYWSRLPTILALPFFVALLEKKVSTVAKFLSGLLIFVLLNGFYNYLRFGTPLDIGYQLIPNVLNEPWFDQGIVHPAYIPRNLKTLFLKLPVREKDWPYLKPSWGGMAIWLTTPAFIFTLFASLKEKIVRLSWLAVFLVALPGLMHGTEGFSQFGYRFAMDFTPFLLILTAKGFGPKMKRRHYFLIILSCLVNLWGVVFINKLGWATW